MEKTYHQTYEYLAGIASILLAGDIQARVVANSTGVHSIEVRLTDDSRVLWSNSSGKWGYSLVRPEAMDTEMTDLYGEAEAEEVAKLIALTDYPAPAAYPAEHPGDDV